MDVVKFSAGTSGSPHSPHGFCQLHVPHVPPVFCGCGEVLCGSGRVYAWGGGGGSVVGESAMSVQEALFPLIGGALDALPPTPNSEVLEVAQGNVTQAQGVLFGEKATVGRAARCLVCTPPPKIGGSPGRDGEEHPVEMHR